MSKSERPRAYAPEGLFRDIVDPDSDDTPDDPPPGSDLYDLCTDRRSVFADGEIDRWNSIAIGGRGAPVGFADRHVETRKGIG